MLMKAAAARAKQEEDLQLQSEAGATALFIVAVSSTSGLDHLAQDVAMEDQREGLELAAKLIADGEVLLLFTGAKMGERQCAYGRYFHGTTE